MYPITTTTRWTLLGMMPLATFTHEIHFRRCFPAAAPQSWGHTTPLHAFGRTSMSLLWLSRILGLQGRPIPAHPGNGASYSLASQMSSLPFVGCLFPHSVSSNHLTSAGRYACGYRHLAMERPFFLVSRPAMCRPSNQPVTSK